MRSHRHYHQRRFKFNTAKLEKKIGGSFGLSIAYNCQGIPEGDI